MPTGVYPHKSGSKSSAWKGGNSKCMICGELTNRKCQTCRPCFLKTYRPTEETKRKMSATHKRLGAPWLKGRRLTGVHLARMIAHNQARSGSNHHAYIDGRSKDPQYRNWIKQRHNRLKKVAVGSHSYADWLSVKAKYSYTCPSCKRSEPTIKLTEDHVIPISRYGTDGIENIQPLCRSCNSQKHTKLVFYEPAYGFVVS